MNVLSTNPGTVPDSAFPFSNELEGLLDAPLSPEGCPMGGLKLAAGQGDSGYAPHAYLQFPFEQDYPCGTLDIDWLCQDTLLPTPQGQDSDVVAFLPPSAAGYPGQNVFNSLPTPDSSEPPSPTSCPDQDVLDALSIIDGSPDSRLNQSADVLPQFDRHTPLSSPASYNPSPITYSSSPTTYEFPASSYEPTPADNFLSSPLTLPAQDFSPEASYLYTTAADSSLPSSPSEQSDGIRGLLVKTEDTPCVGSSSSRKRKSESSSAVASDCVSKGKRRKLSKGAKKERKKEQNKQAALRYRQRKKGEAEVIEDKREELEAINSGLKSQVSALVAEITYLKKLWKEIEAAKARKPHLQTELQSSHSQ